MNDLIDELMVAVVFGGLLKNVYDVWRKKRTGSRASPGIEMMPTKSRIESAIVNGMSALGERPHLAALA